MPFLMGIRVLQVKSGNFCIIKTNRFHKGSLSFLLRLMTLIWFLQILGCAMILEPPVTVKETSRIDPDLMALMVANQALQNGDFKKALEGYEILKHSTDDRIARKARYGIACTHLSLAESPKDVREAIMLWNAWSEQAPPYLEDEDPRILWLLLKQKILPKPKKIRATKEAESEEKRQLEKLLRAKEEEVQRLNKRLKAMENEIQTILKKQADYVGIMESEIQTLRDKINSFEAIDQKIKEKKKEVSSP